MLQSGPQTLLPHLLEVASFGVKNQAEDKERTSSVDNSCCRTRLQLQGHREGTAGDQHQSRGKTNKGKCFEGKSTDHWAYECWKEPPRRRPVCRQTDHWDYSGPEEEEGLLLLR